MKKIMMMAAMFAAVMVSFSACEKEPGKTPGGNGDDEEEPSFASPISIDGDFSDWDALDPSKVSVASNVEVTKFSALKLVKVYADELYVNVYLEWDTDQVANDGSAPNTVHVYFNSDNDKATGGYGDEFSDACIDFCLENEVISTAGEYVSWDPAFFKWWGEPNGTGWLWTDPDITPDSSNGWGAILPNGSGIAKGMGANGKYELQIMREMMVGCTFAETFSVGFDVQANWSSVGVLPNAAMTEDNPNGLANTLSVTIDRTVVE